MSDGTSLVVAKAALLTKLGARTGLAGVPISDAGPVSAQSLQNDSGAYEAIWLGDAHTINIDVPYSGVPVTFDETYDIDLIVQVLKVGTNADTQPAADARAAALLGEVVGTVASAPDLSVAATASLITFDVSIAGWEHTGGWLGKGDEHGCRFVVKVRVVARLALT